MVMVNRKECYEHRIVMERHIGRKLRRDEHVHHKNHNRKDNRIQNLELMNNREHHRYHAKRHWMKQISMLGNKARWGFRAIHV